MDEQSKKIVFSKDLIQKCTKCFLIAFPPFKCENKNCNKIFCESHIKNNKKCLKCNSNVKLDKNLNEILETAEIICEKCKNYILIKYFNNHKCNNNLICKFCDFCCNEKEEFIEHIFNYHKYNILLEFKE